jgi:pantothenate kinase type III
MPCNLAARKWKADPSLLFNKNAKEIFRIGELNPGLVGTDHLAMIESDKS